MELHTPLHSPACQVQSPLYFSGTKPLLIHFCHQQSRSTKAWQGNTIWRVFEKSYVSQLLGSKLMLFWLFVLLSLCSSLAYQQKYVNNTINSTIFWKQKTSRCYVEFNFLYYSSTIKSCGDWWVIKINFWWTATFPSRLLLKPAVSCIRATGWHLKSKSLINQNQISSLSAK